MEIFRSFDFSFLRLNLEKLFLERAFSNLIFRLFSSPAIGNNVTCFSSAIVRFDIFRGLSREAAIKLIFFVQFISDVLEGID